MADTYHYNVPYITLYYIITLLANTQAMSTLREANINYGLQMAMMYLCRLTNYKKFVTHACNSGG